MTSTAKVRIAMSQLCSSADKQLNLRTVGQLVQQAKERGASMVFLPECFSMMSTSSSMTISESESIHPPGPTISNISSLAKDHGIWISAGSIHERSTEEEDMVWNTGFVIDDKGECVGKYRKAHLFSIDTPSVTLGETRTTLPGSSLVCVRNTPVGTLGLAICYDVRFSYLSNLLRYSGGCDTLIYPSAFTVPTGKDHWEVLLRCRALENQCFVVAAAQAGKHSEKRSSYGHSMCVNPNGDVIGDGGGFSGGFEGFDKDADDLPDSVKDFNVYVDLDMEQVKMARDRLQVENHRREGELTGVDIVN
mmetsp:Transcript_20407/g.42770  ORF Transcript_20407/g.42770 Transcript_20407/m.42770 type:complete len:306 (+) Transcript_20407:77-994(+)